jgi:sulfide:quinone oxidoreductase
MKNILILGGGFAGVQAAIDLQKKGIFEVTLISDRDYLFLYPISIWIPTQMKSFNDAKISLHSLQKKHRFNLVIDSIQHIESASKKVTGKQNTYTYDYLVVALGAGKMKQPGIENTLSICGSPDGSSQIKEAFDILVKRGYGKIAMGFGGNPKDKSAVRGGPAFELMFNFHNYLKKKKLRKYFELTFFAPMEQPGAKMGPAALKMLDKMFKQYNIAQRFGKKITQFNSGQIAFEDGSSLNADLIMYIPGAIGNPILQQSDLPLNEAGFIKIDEYCLVQGTKDIYAIGDSAAIEGPDWRAKQGHMADLMGQFAATNIYNQETNNPKREGYQKHLSIVCVMDTGNGAAFVLRNRKRAIIIPLPIVGHWMKKGWEKYIKWNKLGFIPKLPGL